MNTEPMAEPAAEPLRFYFDYLSHNAYLAWGRTREIAARHGLRVEPVPVVFGAMLSAYGQTGPAEIPPKSRWMLRDVLRKARLLNLPIAPPHTHPFKSLPALRLTACEMDAPARLRLIDALWRATWAESREVSNPAVLREIVTAVGLDAQRLEAESNSEAIKQRVRANTDEALAAGVFGVPSIRVRGQMFWGYDELWALERFLDGRDPIADIDLAPWLAVQPSVQRRR